MLELTFLMRRSQPWEVLRGEEFGVFQGKQGSVLLSNRMWGGVGVVEELALERLVRVVGSHWGA